MQLIGDRWSVSIVLGAFLGIHRFDDLQRHFGLPKQSLAQRLKTLMSLGVLEQRPLRDSPGRLGYYLTAKGLEMYPHVLLMWAWERRWGTGELALPDKLIHKNCGHSFVPRLCCAHCLEAVKLTDLQFTLSVNSSLAPAKDGLQRRTPRLSVQAGPQMGLGLRVDRWTLMIVSTVFLGCHYFDQLVYVLGIASSVLARRLGGMVDGGLLLCQTDLTDGRRQVYRLTSASRDLFGYIMCFTDWAGRHHFHEFSSIQTVHRSCAHTFFPLVACSHCHVPVMAKNVQFEGALNN